MVAGNWKMNGSVASNETLLAGIRDGLDGQLLPGTDIMVCPPFPYLGLTRALMKAKSLDELGVELGAQNVSNQPEGAFTGEVAAAMLRDVGCQWTLVGHSERRTLYGDTNELVAEKARKALEGGLGVVVCVGETLDEREAGRTESVLGEQVDAVAPVLALAPQPGRVVVAYEPVWAIGTGKTASPEMAQDAHAFLRARLHTNKLKHADEIRILYGGSVKPDFIAICQAANGQSE
jgi:triosephosphate isomerase